MAESGKGKAAAHHPSRLGKVNSWSSPAAASSLLQPGEKAFLARRNEARAARKCPKIDRSFTLNDIDEIEGFVGLGLDLNSPDLDSNSEIHELLPALEFYRTVTNDCGKNLSRSSSSATAGSTESEAALPGLDRRAGWKKFFDMDDQELMKIRLRQWAKAVACNVRNSA